MAGRVLDSVLTGWRLDPVVAAGLVIVAGLYLAGVRRARRWSSRRTAAFLAGLAVMAIALQSGLADGGEQLLSVHMLQHLLVVLVAPPLLLLGAPVALALRSLPRPQRQALV